MASPHSNPTMTATGNANGTARTPGVSRAALVRKHGIRQIAAGAASFAIGLLITFVTFQHPIGGVFIAAYGPLIFGLISMARGAANVAKSVTLDRKLRHHW
jgi:hypothetical protein